MDIFMSNLYVKGSFVASALDIVDLDGISPAAFRDFTSLVPPIRSTKIPISSSLSEYFFESETH